MRIECAIIGGGPAGMSAALMLGRARRKVILFDDNQPRNAVTQHSHNFLTRDGVTPDEFRALGRAELGKYPSVELHPRRIERVTKQADGFELIAEGGERFEAATILLATGVREILPSVEGIYDYYGKSLFNCPYCDGWELRDQPLVIIAETEMAASHLPRVLYNWSRDIVVCTNGQPVLNEEQRAFFARYGIGLVEERIVRLVGQDGQLKRVVFESGQEIERTGDLVGIQWKQATAIGEELGCAVNDLGGIAADQLGRTNVKGVYAAGDTSTTTMQAQLIAAAAAGNRAGAGINTELTESYFAQPTFA